MVSIIVPVYKSELTLTRCVESLLAQDYENIEILLIVDGPPDGSGILAQELAKRDDRIRVINQPNQGVSRARNRGLLEARGRFVRFVDSDDYVQPGELSRMVERLLHDGSDMVIAGFHHLYFGRTITKLPHMDGVIETKKDFAHMQRLYEDGFLNMPWNKLFYRERILSNGDGSQRETFGFPVDLSLGEDLVFNQDYIARTERISVMQICSCEYVQDDRGTTLSSKKRDDRIDMALLLHRRSTDFFKALYGERDLGFLDEKVVTTLLDEMECLGFADGNGREKRESLKKYMKACRRFMQEQNCSQFCPALLDYRIILFFVRKNQLHVTYLMICLRTLVVRLSRALPRK